MSDTLTQGQSASQSQAGEGKPLDASSRLYLIDGSGYIFRAYHALPPLTRPSDGLPVGAVAGFCNMLWKFICDMKLGERPTHLAVVFDRSEHTFRNELYDQYKANRSETPEDLIPQFPLIREATRAFSLPVVEMDGFEADDLIATYARQAAKAGAKVTIISSDKDLMQLIDEGQSGAGTIAMFDPMKNKPIGSAEVMEKFGVTPDKVIEAQALIGDSTDNVPGCPGIGPKTAAELIGVYGDIETLLSRVDEIKQPKRRESLAANAEKIRLSKVLVTLRDDVETEDAMDTFALTDPNPDLLLAFIDQMEFRTLGKRVREQFARDEVAAATPAPRASPQAAAESVEEPPIDFDAYKTVDTIEALTEWIARIRAKGQVAIDIQNDETCVPTSGLAGIALSLGPNDACYIPLGHGDKDAEASTDLFSAPAKPSAMVTQIPFAEAIAALKPILEDDSILKIGHNTKYMMLVFARIGINLAPIDDVMLISYTQGAGRDGHGLEDLSERHLGHTPISFKDVTGSGKNKLHFRHVPIVAATRYSAEDADLALRLWKRLKPKLASERLLTTYETLERGMPAILAMMERDGIKIDREALAALSVDFERRMKTHEEEAQRLAGHEFNIGSPKQIGDILFGEMKMPGGVKTKTGAWSTDADVLEDLAIDSPLPRAILDWRLVSKLRSTYTEALAQAADPKTNRVHTYYSLAATPTGRLSSTEPNLQNIPVRTAEGRRIREAFIAEPGHVLISADYSQIELRLLAHVADIPALKQAFADGIDIHALTASEMFGVPVEGMDANIRRNAKAINFGIIYGISAFGLARNLGIERGEADAYIKRYFERFPQIRAYMETMKAHARELGYVTTVFGRRIYTPTIKSPKPAERSFAERQSINAPLQGAAADIIRRAMIRMPDALRDAGLKARMLLQVHDELVFEAPESEAEATCALVKEVMEQSPKPAVHLTVPITVEANAAKTWAGAH